MNNISIVGRIVREPELTFLKGSGTAKLTFTVAVDRSYQKDKENKKTDFIPCEILGKRAESLSNYVTKGQLVSVTGELHIENYQKDGQWKTFVTVQVNNFGFLGGNKKEESPKIMPQFQAIDDDELPFL